METPCTHTQPQHHTCGQGCFNSNVLKASYRQNHIKLRPLYAYINDIQHFEIIKTYIITNNIITLNMKKQTWLLIYYFKIFTFSPKSQNQFILEFRCIKATQHDMALKYDKKLSFWATKPQGSP